MDEGGVLGLKSVKGGSLELQINTPVTALGLREVGQEDLLNNKNLGEGYI